MLLNSKNIKNDNANIVLTRKQIITTHLLFKAINLKIILNLKIFGTTPSMSHYFFKFLTKGFFICFF